MQSGVKMFIPQMQTELSLSVLSHSLREEASFLQPESIWFHGLVPSF